MFKGTKRGRGGGGGREDECITNIENELKQVRNLEYYYYYYIYYDLS